MEIKDQVCSLELGKELKKLGVKQDSYWYWENYSKNAYGYVKEWQLTDGSCLDDEINVIGLRDPKDYEIYSAFTDAELEREIFQIIGNRYDFAIHFSPTGGVWGNETFNKMYEVDIIDWFDREESLMERADTGANTKAKMLIRLLKNKLAEK